MDHWTPEDIDRITTDVAAVPQLQQQLLGHACADMKFADRAAHEYQIAGGRVSLRISAELPEPRAEYLHVFSQSEIDDALAAELRRRREAKRRLGHVDAAA